jgi:hypothetical protein
MNMDKVFVVKVLDWNDDYTIFSVHRTSSGAENKIEEANERYATSSAYVDEIVVEE